MYVVFAGMRYISILTQALVSEVQQMTTYSMQILTLCHRDVDRIDLCYITRRNGHHRYVGVRIRHSSVATSQRTHVVSFNNMDITQRWYVAASAVQHSVFIYHILRDIVLLVCLPRKLL